MDNKIAIVGMSCRFAGCPNIPAFWDAVVSRRSNLTSPGADVALRFGSAGVFHRAYPSRIGQLGDLYSCVPAMQNFPRQVNAGENQDLYFATQLAFDALADASIRPRSREPLRGSVRIGYAPPFNASTMNWLQHTEFLEQTMEIVHRFFPHAPAESLETLRARLVESLPMPDASSFLLGSGYRFASWVARECAFSGTATILDAGMLSGAAVLMSACDDLNSGRADVALAGAFTPPIARSYLMGIAGEVDFSTESGYAPYSAVQTGTIPGEGGAFFVLKRRADALKAHDRVYALISGVEIGRDDEGVAGVIRTAMEYASTGPSGIALIEGDGSGIGEAEQREVASLQSIWGEHAPGGALTGLGSVKGNIGHTLHAAMSAGIVKSALALRYRILPPQLKPDNPAEPLLSPSSSVYLLDAARPWITGDSTDPRRALVIGSNFSMPVDAGHVRRCGRAAAVVLEEEPEDLS